MAGLQHLCPTWAALFPSPCPPVSGPNKFALNGARVARSLRFGWGPHPRPPEAGDVFLRVESGLLSCPLPQTHARVNSAQPKTYPAPTPGDMLSPSPSSGPPLPSPPVAPASLFTFLPFPRPGSEPQAVPARDPILSEATSSGNAPIKA